jgi:Protein of unknown function (DUF2939)
MARLVNLVVAAAVIGALAFLTAPWFALRAVQAAARDQDTQALLELVDYTALRLALRETLGPEPAPAPTPGILQDPIGAMRRAIEPARPTPARIESYLSAAGLYALTCGREPDAAMGPDACKSRPRLRYWDTNSARFSVSFGAAEPVIFTFRRKSAFGWRLVHVAPPKPPRMEG